jgi:hypothetical protein
MRILTTLLLLLALGSAQAQEKPAPVAPPPADLEPAVDTTKSLPASPAPVPAPARAAAPKSDNAAPPASGGVAAGKPGAARAAGKGTDRVELETTDITGNRELPKVLYIVPWRRSDLGDLVGKPPNSLLDEVLQPIDRDVFLRENRYYDALKPDAVGPRAGTVPGSGEKP